MYDTLDQAKSRFDAARERGRRHQVIFRNPKNRPLTDPEALAVYRRQLHEYDPTRFPAPEEDTA